MWDQQQFWWQLSELLWKLLLPDKLACFRTICRNLNTEYIIDEEIVIDTFNFFFFNTIFGLDTSQRECNVVTKYDASSIDGLNYCFMKSAHLHKQIFLKERMMMSMAMTAMFVRQASSQVIKIEQSLTVKADLRPRWGDDVENANDGDGNGEWWRYDGDDVDEDKRVMM